MFDWLRAAKGKPEPSTEGGSSGYLSSPVATLDPHLFDGEKLKIAVRDTLTIKLVNFLLTEMRMHKVSTWIRVWLAGSGITYQWDSDRGNGDLDVLLGVDRVKFNQANPEFASYDDDDLAAVLNAAMKAHLWPATASQDFGGQPYEVTYFYNAGTGTDINRIHPYAAYDVMHDRWVVRPPKLPSNPASLYPRDWFERAGQDAKQADSLVKRYRMHARSLEVSPPGSPGHVNAGAALNLVTAQAHALLNDIHHGRRVAFQGGGRGYGDWNNFRWQQAKASGAVKGLSEVTGIAEAAHEQTETELYGAPLEGADELLRRAQGYKKP